ncbi:MAG: adenosylcobinamide-phosphate synthase CbiB [Desulforhopalus sp.]
MILSLQILAAVVLDGMFGDPRWYPHPVRIIGLFCSWSERFSRNFLGNLYFAGVATVLLVLAATVSAAFSLVGATASINGSLGAGFAVVLLYTTIAASDLFKHSNTVFRELTTGSLDDSRAAVAQIVGRDTTALDDAGVCRACVETVAENMVDGITAPLFYAVLASLCAPFVAVSPIGCAAIGALAYKAINTMDSMVGYKNDKYRQFGWAAAKLDDLVNFVPARLSGVCLILAAFVLQFDYRGAARVFLRDRLNHSSPNAGHPEAAVAGALNIQLGGPSSYFGSLVDKPYIGDSIRRPVPADIKKSNTLVVIGSLIFGAVVLALRAMVS